MQQWVQVNRPEGGGGEARPDCEGEKAGLGDWASVSLSLLWRGESDLGEAGAGRRRLRSSTCPRSSSTAWVSAIVLSGKRLCLSGDCSELELAWLVVWAGRGEQDLLVASETQLISMLEHEGSVSSGLEPALSDASRTEYLEDEKAAVSGSARHFSGFSKSMLCCDLRWPLMAARLGADAPHSLQDLSPLAEVGGMCSF